MEDANVFAVLTARDYKAAEQLASDANAAYHERTEYSDTNSDNGASREITPASSLYHIDRLVLKFTSPLKDRLEGWRFGTGPESDVIIGQRGRSRGVSANHFSIRVDEQGSIFLHDHSSYGTAVTYAIDRGHYLGPKEFQKNESWILYRGVDGPITEHMFITLPDGMEFEVEFPHHETVREQYLKNLHQFHEDNQRASSNVQRVDLENSPVVVQPPNTPQQWF